MSMVEQKAHCLFVKHLDSEVHLLCKHTVELQNTPTEGTVCVVFLNFYAELQTPFSYGVLQMWLPGHCAVRSSTKTLRTEETGSNLLYSLCTRFLELNPV